MATAPPTPGTVAPGAHAAAGGDADDTSAFDAVKAVRRLAGGLEETVKAALKTESTSSEREIWSTVQKMMAPDLKLAACGYLEAAIMGVLHVLYSKGAETQAVGVVQLPANAHTTAAWTPADIVFAEKAATTAGITASPPPAPPVKKGAATSAPANSSAPPPPTTATTRPLTTAESDDVVRAAYGASHDAAIRLAARWLSPAEKDEVRAFLADLIETCHPSYTIPALLTLKSPHQKPFEGVTAYGVQISELLDRAVLRPDGVAAIAQTLLSDLTEEQADGYQRVANAVVRTPRFLHSAEEHLRLLAPQVRALWIDGKAWQSTCISEFLPLLFIELFKRTPRLVRKHLLRPTLRALYVMTDAASARSAHAAAGEAVTSAASRREAAAATAAEADADDESGKDGKPAKSSSLDTNVVCTATETIGALDCLHRLILSIKQKTLCFSMFGSLLPSLLKIQATLHRSPMQARHAVEEIIVRLLKCDEARARLALLTHVAYATGLDEAAVAFKGLPTLLSPEDTSQDEEGYYYTPSVLGGVELRYGVLPPRDDVASLTHLLDLLSTKHHSQVPGDLLADLLEELMARDEADAHAAAADAAAPATSTPAASGARPLLDVHPAVAERAERDAEAKRNVTRLALAVIEKIGAACLKNGSQAITIITYLITLSPLKTREDARRGVGADPSAAALGDAELKEELDTAATTGLTLLQLALTDKIVLQASPAKLARLHRALKGMSSDDTEIRQMLAAVRLGVERLVAKQQKQESGGRGTDTDGSSADTGGGGGTRVVSDDDSEIVLQNIFADITSPNAAMVGHGLISMKRFASNPQHRTALEANFDAIFETFVAHAADEESFIYISAGNGLVALCDAMPEKTLEALMERYRPPQPGVGGGGARARGQGATASGARETLRQHRRRAGNEDREGEGKFRFGGGGGGTADGAREKGDAATARTGEKHMGLAGGGIGDAGLEPIPVGRGRGSAASTHSRPKGPGGPRPRPSLKQSRDHRLADAQKEEERVVKLADILTYCVWRTGTGLRPKVADVMLERCHYKQTELVRASAMQALADMAFQSPWAIYGAVDRLLQTMYDVLAMDPTRLCQRAAASFIYHLFCGMRNDAVMYLDEHLPNMLDIARRRLRDPDPVIGEYFRLFLEEANSLRLEMHGAPQQSLFSKRLNVF